MTRSVYKGPYVQYHLVRKIRKMKKENIDLAKAVIKTYSRRSTILPSFIGMTFEVHNGRRFVRFYVNENMVGKKLGEFSITRSFKKHSGDKVRNFVR